MGQQEDARVEKLADQLRDALVDAGERPDTAAAMVHAARRGQTNLVGNLADLQRMGGAMAMQSGGLADSFQVNPAQGAEPAVAPPSNQTTEPSPPTPKAAATSGKG